ncbi:hypothetical protein NECAME_09538 [Necator americanus]|uniref:Uncharacterized protein n=1 Tax=Necator americanus TaxID=51031 RepID=W2TDI8_NECAM|nr:hypothetical protein NECAME_09538 [Necator americanus]ETN79883.1 hypothetical protein NECAME_09538 [Necator americanus]
MYVKESHWQWLLKAILSRNCQGRFLAEKYHIFREGRRAYGKGKQKAHLNTQRRRCSRTSFKYNTMNPIFD